MKKVRSKNGFTLVELIVVIALMISILVIAIVSFTNISSSKKSESWSYVKQEIETAAEEYFTSNAYLFEGLGDETTEGTISLGKLVSLGYLSSVTDPRTGEALSSCTVVRITKSNGVLTASLDETSISNGEDESCDTTYSLSVTIAESKAPEFTLEYYKDSNCTESTVTPTSSGYFNISKLGKENAAVYVKITPTSSSNIHSYNVTLNNKTIKNAVASAKDSYYCVALEDDVTKVQLEVSLTGKNGKTTTTITDYAKDTVYPVCSSTTDAGSESNWTNSSRTIKQYCSDATSGCTQSVTSKTFTSDATTGKIAISDNAGNSTNCTVGVYIDTEAPTCSVSFNGTKGNGKWYIKDDVTVSLTNLEDNLSGVVSSSAAVKKSDDSDSTYTSKGSQTSSTKGQEWTGKVTDNAGNVGYCTSTVYFEKSVTLTLSSTTDEATAASQNYNKYVFGTKTSGTRSVIKYVTDSGSGKCTRKNSAGNYVACQNTSGTTKYYYGRACRDISDFTRTFKVTAVSDGYSEKEIYWAGTGSGQSTSKKLTVTSKYSYKINISDHSNFFDNTYQIGNIGKDYTDGTNTNLTVYEITYESTAGNTSNAVWLYTEYSVNCGYSKTSK